MNLTPEQEDIIGEVINQGMGVAAMQLEEIVEHPIQLKAPEVKFIDQSFTDYIVNSSELDLDLILLSQGFEGEIFGLAHILFPKDASLALLNLMQFDDSEFTQINEMTKDGLQEIANTLINACIGSISNILKLELKYLPPNFTYLANKKSTAKDETILAIEHLNSQISDQGSSKYTIVVKTYFGIKGKKINGSFLISMNINAVKSFLDLLDEYLEGLLQ